MRKAFIDSSAFLSLVNPHDVHHAEARVIWTRLTGEHWRTFTSNFVVAETHALFLARIGRQRAASFLEQINTSATLVLRVTLPDEQAATAIVLRYDDKDFSLTDATSFAIMRRLQIPSAFTFDKNFSQYGLPVLTDADHQASQQ
ncbi:MAG: type II toxin-antitoxin system VapC family toxin [Chloroflexi bacterium]|nr:type II toxin-antitoxin system VapC family toxin [Chloroflexota bacterium]